MILAAIFCVGAAWFFVRWNFANMISTRLDIDRPESKLVADWLVDFAPADPQSHFTAAALYEKTFDDADLLQSLKEYETATALSPNNYLMWLNLGRARNLNGNTEGADAAFARSLELAPNYAQIQWVYGNFLIRQAKIEEGFTLVAKAAASNSEYSQAAAISALQIFDSDIAQAQRYLGNTDTTNAALVSALSGQKRSDEAVDVWSNLGAVDRTDKYKKLGETLISNLAAAKKFQLAARVTADLQTSDAERPVVGAVANGGFENAVKLRNAGLFEWQIADGGEPQIGLNETQKHSGKGSLIMAFNSVETAAFRTVTQTVAVVPGGEYDLEIFYRSDLKSAAKFKWEIADAVAGGVIASTQPLTTAADWTSLKATFRVPVSSDGIIIRFVREGCSGLSCPANGKVYLDDIGITKKTN